MLTVKKQGEQLIWTVGKAYDTRRLPERKASAVTEIETANERELREQRIALEIDEKNGDLNDFTAEMLAWVREEEREAKANTARLDASISRTKARIAELVACNEWDFFVTLTLNHDRDKRQAHVQDLSEWIRKCAPGMKYLLIPEYHKDGENVHFHGFFKNVPKEQLLYVDNGYGKKRLNMRYWYKNKGFSQLENIRNRTACARYVQKYITKELALCCSQGERTYYASKGLQRAEVLTRVYTYDDTFRDALEAFEALPTDAWENDYVRKKTINIKGDTK